jgi:acyl-CoA thioesterase
VPPKRRPRSDAAGPETVALDSATAMLSRDEASSGLGIELVAVGPGRAEVGMTVRADMVNGLDVCHGGLIFTLADTAMAVASNSHGSHAVAVAAAIDFVAPVHRGAQLTAVATEQHHRGRTGLYDVIVTDGDGAIVARFHGRTHERRS